ncbi:phytanoyl-CoA dioxygenase family protein [Candidatus Binatia bacterium]|nr:phytanoyl-CoA dioxygenase family protein [Candidatus Binatia bacterium]
MALPEGFAPIEFVEYHRRTLPQRLASGRAGGRDASTAYLPSLALRVGDGASFTYHADERGIAIEPGDARAATVLEIGLEDWCGLVHELDAPAGLVYGGRVRSVRGNAADLMAWESTLRALYNGRPPYRPEALDLRDRNGAPLDPQRAFAPGHDRADMEHFLDTAGYLFVRGVFTPAEAARMLDEAIALRAEARPGDRLSWWGRNADGEEVLTRVTRANVKHHLGGLPAEPRLLALVALANRPLVHTKGEGEGVTVIYKQPGMSDGGLADLPWHRDCGMGGHAILCPTLLLSIYLREATPESGELAMLPGSHRASYNAHDLTIDPWRHAARFAARPGDVSVHYGDTVHAAPPPADPRRAEFRVSAVVCFAPPGARPHRGDASYNDALHQREDGQIEHLDRVAKRL